HRGDPRADASLRRTGAPSVAGGRTQRKCNERIDGTVTELNDLELRVRAIEDRLAIEDVIIRYAHGVDGQDDELVASCFSDDADATFAGAPAGPGGPAIAAFLASTMGTPRVQSTHRFTNVAVTLDGEQADVHSSAVEDAVRGDPVQSRHAGHKYP